MSRFGVVVLAGGAGRRLGGAAKPTLVVAGRPMLARVLAAVDDAAERVVVGPPSLGPLVSGMSAGGMSAGGVVLVQEEPPGGGPVAGLAAGLAEVSAEHVLVLAADLPLLTREAVGALLGALGGHDGAVFVDGNGRQQWLCGAWSSEALRRRLAVMEAGGPLAGRAMRELVAPLAVVGVQGDDVPVGGVPVGGVPGSGMPGGVRGDGVRGDGVRGDGVRGSGVRGDGAPGDGVRGDGVRGDGVRGDSVPGDGAGRPPWYDCDTPADLADAERRLT
ncbi:hypothetical protein Voc01_013070 [Virgisporangium ochraceum]|uniref:MobA-like NTP transferase domain-containing protein n=1 Tax=Virgisporangium ochraceum TaxID=65505 RepID=A0A8J3ZQF2_9ACTN|nr:NTP transferase domain-containing protein [Virgisporangium ochraceum]GIJ66390.1 hypothetical protein Voc01_013070 [Virgisporangium ochraceum]